MMSYKFSKGLELSFHLMYFAFLSLKQVSGFYDFRQFCGSQIYVIVIFTCKFVSDG